MYNHYIKFGFSLEKLHESGGLPGVCMVNGNDSTATKTVLYVVVVVVAVLISTVLAPVVWSATQPSGDGEERATVEVITLRGGTTSANAAAISEDLREARTNASTEAVVLRIDSGGGPVTSSEELYLAVNRTAQEMPVVAYVEGVAASGGYMTVLPADAIYVKPSSIVGSVGVVATIPAIVEQSNQAAGLQIRSGPNKQIQTVDEIRNIVEDFQNSFVGSVMRHRGDRLDVSETEISRAGVYTGAQAVQNGVVDEIGSLESAIQRAAEESEAIEGDEYDVHYNEPPDIGIGIILAQSDVQKTEGDIVVVDRGSGASDDFEQPVKFYAVWGIHENRLADGNTEVTANETN